MKQILICEDIYIHSKFLKIVFKHRRLELGVRIHRQQPGNIKSLLILNINRVKYKRLKKKKLGMAFIIQNQKQMNQRIRSKN